MEMFTFQQFFRNRANSASSTERKRGKSTRDGGRGTERLVTKTTRDTCELYSRNRIEKKQRIVVGFESVN